MKSYYEAIKKKFVSMESILKIIRATKNHFKDVSVSFNKCSEKIKDSNKFDEYENVFDITNKLLNKIVYFSNTMELNYCNISKEIMIIHDNLKITSNSIKSKIDVISKEIEHLKKLENLENTYNEKEKSMAIADKKYEDIKNSIDDFISKVLKDLIENIKHYKKIIGVKDSKFGVPEDSVFIEFLDKLSKSCDLYSNILNGTQKNNYKELSFEVCLKEIENSYNISKEVEKDMHEIEKEEKYISNENSISSEIKRDIKNNINKKNHNLNQENLISKDSHIKTNIKNPIIKNELKIENIDENDKINKNITTNKNKDILSKETSNFKEKENINEDENTFGIKNLLIKDKCFSNMNDLNNSVKESNRSKVNETSYNNNLKERKNSLNKNKVYNNNNNPSNFNSIKQSNIHSEYQSNQKQDKNLYKENEKMKIKENLIHKKCLIPKHLDMKHQTFSNFSNNENLNDYNKTMKSQLDSNNSNSKIVIREKLSKNQSYNDNSQYIKNEKKNSQNLNRYENEEQYYSNNKSYYDNSEILKNSGKVSKINNSQTINNKREFESNRCNIIKQSIDLNNYELDDSFNAISNKNMNTRKLNTYQENEKEDQNTKNIIKLTNKHLIKDEFENDIEMNDSKFIVNSKDSNVFISNTYNSTNFKGQGKEKEKLNTDYNISKNNNNLANPLMIENNKKFVEANKIKKPHEIENRLNIFDIDHSFAVEFKKISNFKKK